MYTTLKPTTALVVVVMMAVLSPTALASNIVIWPETPFTTAEFAPPSTLIATTMSVGMGHACAIEAGTSALVCWGGNLYQQATVPPSLGPVKAVACGSLHSCAVTQAGGVVCFGANDRTQTNVPAGLEGATAVAASGSHSCALIADGAPVCWGASGSGQSTPPPGLKGLTQIVAGAGFTAALDPAGNVVIWGENRDNRLTPPPGIQGAVDKIFASGLTLCAVTKTGGVACFEADDRGGLPPPPSDLAAVTSVAIGFNYGCASLAPEGRVSCWGTSPLNHTSVPEGLSGVTQVAASSFVMYALKGN